MRLTFPVAVVLLFAAVCAMSDEAKIVWKDARDLTIEGRGWVNTADPYRRYPERAQSLVPEPVWTLAGNSSGICVRFQSNAPSISAKWELNSAMLAMNHFPATGVSGVDLYVRDGKHWRWLGVGRPAKQSEEQTLISGLSRSSRQYILYLPLYNGVNSVQIGVPESSDLTPAAARKPAVKPVVFYGTSITQGGCASRPGMAYPAIIGRRLDIETINLGFSGSGKLEHNVADLLAELDPSVYVIDALPNMGAVQVEERMTYLLKVLKAKRPKTPVVLVESAGSQSDYIRRARDPEALPINKKLQKAARAAREEWGDLLFVIKGRGLVSNEGTVDGVHPTDVGFIELADAMTPVIEEALTAK